MMATKLSIIMPVLDETAVIESALRALSHYRERGVELIVVDGGSHDDTPALARPLTDRVITAPRGRAVQMNAGAAIAQGNILLFLHADTQLPENADTLVCSGLTRTGRPWGHFGVRIEGGRLLWLIARMMNLRSRITEIATGDQAIFISRAAFDAVGGFPPIALMEDIALSARLKRIGPPLCLRERVTTSPRRWRDYGTLRTVFLMWRLRLAYFLGADPAQLAQRYGYASAEQ
jgi:rSAM/selenodomain-associated transferase 2